MLRCLRVQQLAIIDELEVGFEPGLNVVTGETGAGKSILVGALQLVLGARGRADAVRTGADQAEVEALLDISDEPSIAHRLEALGLPVDEELVLRRVNQRTGRTRAYINGKLATATQLRSLAAGLVDLSSQHEYQTLANPGTHLQALDDYARLQSERQALSQAWEALLAAQVTLDELQDRLRHRTEREDLLRYQLREMEALDLAPGEYEALEGEARRLRNAEQLAQATRGAEAALNDRDQSICSQIAALAADLSAAADQDPSLSEQVRILESSRLELEEAARDLGRYGRSVVSDPARLARLEERLHQIRRLARKYGGSAEALLERRAEARAELAAVQDWEAELEAAEARRDRALQAAADRARSLSVRRREHAEELAEAFSRELDGLGMGGARVRVEVSPLENRTDSFQVDGARLSATGLDRAEFLIAPNRGEQPRPLRRIASGGELSRALLALKRVLAGLGPVGTYVFDEVDAGVGGAVAEVIGRKLVEVSRHHQVICVTHLPQIAAYADVHFRVEKGVVGDRTASRVQRLHQEDRERELARMVGGVDLTDATHEAAADLLEAARRIKRAD